VLDFILQLLASATVSAAIAGVFIFLFQTWISERLRGAIKAEYDQRLETHKAQLKAQSDIEIERLKSQLQIAAIERQVQFSRLHDRRAGVIAETHSLLQRLFSALGKYVNIVEFEGDAPRVDRSKEAIEAHHAFSDYYVNHLIFLPKRTATKLQSINKAMVETFNEFYRVVDEPSSSDLGKESRWLDIYKRVGVEIGAALTELEDEFRRLLGDEGSG
jgi:hypothetical protein